MLPSPLPIQAGLTPLTTRREPANPRPRDPRTAIPRTTDRGSSTFDTLVAADPSFDEIVGIRHSPDRGRGARSQVFASDITRSGLRAATSAVAPNLLNSLVLGRR